jgi:hypothetical protein
VQAYLRSNSGISNLNLSTKFLWINNNYNPPHNRHTLTRIHTTKRDCFRGKAVREVEYLKKGEESKMFVRIIVKIFDNETQLIIKRLSKIYKAVMSFIIHSFLLIGETTKGFYWEIFVVIISSLFFPFIGKWIYYID